MLDTQRKTEKPRVLILCRSMRDLDLLSQIQPSPNSDYLIATDDVRIHERMGKYSWISEAHWLEKEETFYDVADDVLRLLEVINQWLGSLGEGTFRLPKEILFWIRHSEGGFTTQTLQDLLLLIRSYSSLITTAKPSGIVMLNSAGEMWEDEVFLSVVKSIGINDVTFIGRSQSRVSFPGIEFIKAFARELVQVLIVLRTRLLVLTGGLNKAVPENSIYFQLMGWAEKHVENVLPLMTALEEINLRPIALCWCGEKMTAKPGSFFVRKAGLPAIDLEAYLPLFSFITSPLRFFITWLCALLRKSEFTANKRLIYADVALGKMLWPAIRHFFLREVMARSRFQIALKFFLAECPAPAAVKIWGGMSFFESKILAHQLRQGDHPLLIEVPIAAVGFAWPYFPREEHVDLFLVAGEQRKKLLLDEGVKVHQIAVVGAYRYEHIAEFTRTHSPSDSREFLNIPLTFEHYILFDSNKIIRGFMSCREQAEITATLLDIMKNYKNAALIIKPHPGHAPGMLESLVAESKLENIFFVDRFMLPYHAINAAHILLTRISTIGVEAMLFEKPVIAALFNGEKRFEIYNPQRVMRSPQELTAFFAEYITENLFRARWVNETLSMQERYLKDNLSIQFSQSPSCLGAEAIKTVLAKTAESVRDVSKKRFAVDSTVSKGFTT